MPFTPPAEYAHLYEKRGNASRCWGCNMHVFLGEEGMIALEEAFNAEGMTIHPVIPGPSTRGQSLTPIFNPEGELNSQVATRPGPPSGPGGTRGKLRGLVSILLSADTE